MIEAQIKIEGGEQLLAEMRALGIRASGALRAGMRAGASIIQQAAEQRAPYRRRPRKATRTRASTKRDVVTVRVMPTRRRWYLRLVETGTKPHLIRARRLVVFEGRSGLIATRVVRHPGARPGLGCARRLTRRAIRRWWRSLAGCANSSSRSVGR